ncbi:hypothetical protein D3C78_1625520 [compost metagenome]
MKKETMNDELKIYSFPKGFAINEIGQVLSLQVCGQEYIYDFLALPLRNILNDRKVGV